MHNYSIINYDAKYQKDILKLWNDEVGFIFPISEIMFNQKVNNCKYFKKEASFIALDKDDSVLGFILGKAFDNNPIIEKYYNKGWISLIYISRKVRKNGIGSKLLENCENKLRDLGVTSISIGSDIHNFFPGIPNDFDNLSNSFFRKRGYVINAYTHDLIRKLTKEDMVKYQDYNNNQYIEEYYDENLGKVCERVIDVELRYAKKTDQEELLDFFKRCFYGRWYDECWEYFQNNQIRKEYLLALVKGKIVGFLRVNNQLIDEISYNINWKDRFNKLVGIGPLGVDIEYRCHGIAKMLLYYSISDSAKNGYSDAMIDWTGLVTYYQRFGYEVWKCYHYASKDL